MNRTRPSVDEVGIWGERLCMVGLGILRHCSSANPGVGVEAPNHEARLVAPLLAVTLAAYGAAPDTRPPTNLGVNNGTTVTVSIVVNGQVVGTVAPARSRRPWMAGRCCRHSPGPSWPGRRPGLSFDRLQTGDYTATGAFGSEADLACGTLRMWTGDTDLNPGSPAPGSSPARPAPAGRRRRGPSRSLPDLMCELAERPCNRPADAPSIST